MRRERGCYVVERPDGEELKATRAWWARYNFTDETAQGTMIPGNQSYGLLAWWAYEREHRRLVAARTELRAYHDHYGAGLLEEVQQRAQTRRKEARAMAKKKRGGKGGGC